MPRLLKPTPVFTRIAAGFLGFFLAGISLQAWAEQASYDRYGAIFKKEPAPESSTQNALTHFLVYPFELIKWPVDQGLVFVEKEHLYEKTIYLYEKIQDFGITPKIGLNNNGTKFDFVRMAQQKTHFPDLIVQGWTSYAHRSIFEVGSKAGLERIGGTGFRAFGIFNYESRPEEYFHGIGPNTSRGDGTSYKLEATTLSANVGYAPHPLLSGDLKFSYRNINITNGEDGGRGIIDRIFSSGSIPGLSGDELLSIGPEFVWDTRNQRENSTAGGRLRLGFNFNEGLGNSTARYFKYEADASRYFTLGSARRVLALRFHGEHNNELSGRDVPFHQMAKLGGYGAYPSVSQTLRGFAQNRFFAESDALLNLEYRYTIWEYKDWKLDTVLFWDEGQVFRDFSDFQFKDFKESYGLGFRISILNHAVLGLEWAHGDEGTNFYVETRAPF